jgi:glycosyltransferase involved in cell wall biosynthesis
LCACASPGDRLAGGSLAIEAMPQISVVVPLCNVEAYVRPCLESIAAQTAAHLEVIVVDDGSTDATDVALRRQFGRESRVQVISTPRRYASAARNAGFLATTGALICFLDSDDFWLPGTLAAIAWILARTPGIGFLSIDGSTLPTPERPALPRIVAGDSPGWSHAGFRHARLASATLSVPGSARSSVLLRGDFFPAIIHGDLFYLSGLVMRRDVVAGAGPFNERFRYFNDWEFFARMCLQGAGAYVDHDGFRRDTGRGDQISRRRPVSAMPRRHLFILRSLVRNPAARRATDGRAFESALDDAHYMMGRRLLETGHFRWSRRYLMYCLARRYKFWRSLALLASAWLPRPASDAGARTLG